MNKTYYAATFRHYPSALTVEMAAHLLGCSTKLVYKLIRNGAIPTARVGRSYRIAKTELIDFLAGRDKKASNPA